MLARSPSQAFAPMHDLLAAPPPADLASLLASLRQVEALLDAMPGVVFFVKDERARYVLVNRTLARRCGVKDKAELLGRSADEVFPSSLGPLYAEQDRRVLRGGATLENQLELHLYPGRQPGWCLTHKQALRDADGAIIGMAGISHDLPAAQSAHPAYGRLAAVDAHIREHYDQPLSLADLTAIAGLSVAQLERHCKRIFQLTPRQMIHKARLGAASQLLAGDAPITEIALRCGYTDHSAFSRQFKALTGLSPSQYRETHRQPRKAERLAPPRGGGSNPAPFCNTAGRARAGRSPARPGTATRQPKRSRSSERFFIAVGRGSGTAIAHLKYRIRNHKYGICRPPTQPHRQRPP